jgi:shikimate O-hydroxycinnamoyltransferase
MEKSLAETLSLFYPLGGRYIKDEFSVECNDMGAEFLEAKVGGFLSQLLEREERESEMASHLVAPLFQTENSPLVIVQFNMFECGGLAIGISIAHRIADAFTIGTFINAWSTACRIGSEKVHCRPSFQLGSLFPPKEMPSSSGTAPGTDIKIIRRRFVFDGHTLSKLKAIARGGDSEQLVIKHHPSRVEVVTALIWMALIRVAQARHGHLRPSLLGLTFNMRGKTAMTTPDYSCGNFVNWANAQFMPDDEIKMELHHFVNRVHDAISTTTHDCAKASNSDDIYSMVSSKAREVGEALGEGNVDTYMFSCWCRFPWYEADFGWGKPSWVSSVDVPTGIVMLIYGH